tara:strand:+ start:678 stop:1064 length:387 start_codon:yes stop_codon:yes gene_type:complete
MSAYDKLYWIERDAISIVEKKSNSEYISPSEVKQVTMFVTKEDGDFVSANNSGASSSDIGMLDEPAIPKEFHEALAYKVIQQGYERKPDQIQLAQYFKNSYMELVLEGKRVANTELDGSNYHIVGHDY